jgi:hypothetical protein
MGRFFCPRSNAVREWQYIPRIKQCTDGNELEAISTPFEVYYIQDGMSRCPEITVLEEGFSNYILSK